MNGTPRADVPVLLLKPEEVATALRISRSAVFMKLKSGEIESLQIGRLRRVSVDAVKAYIALMQDRQNAA